MKKAIFIILSLAVVVSTLGLVGAADVKTVAVLPFDIHSSENIDYIRDGVWDMLISRVSVNGKIDVFPKHDVLEAIGKRKKGDLTVADAYALGKKMKANYVVFGSITKIGNSVSLDGKLLDIATYKSPVDVFSQSQGMDDVIPKIGDFAKRIDYHLLGQVPGTFGTPPAPVGPPSYGAAPQPQAGAPGRDPEAIEAVKTRQGTFTSIINPDFIAAPQSIDRKGFWMSQRFEADMRGMDIGDVNGDGKNEVVVIDQQNIFIYQRVDKTLKLLQKMTGESYDQYLSVDVFDLTGSGKKEIIVTSVGQQSLLDSFILQYKEGKYVKIAKDLRWFLRVVDVSGTPTLVGQKMGIQMPFGTPIHEMDWRNGNLREGKRMQIPQGLSIYGLILGPLEKDGPERVIAFDSYDYLRVFELSTKQAEEVNVSVTLLPPIWKSDDVFGGSNNYFDLTKSQQTSTRIDYKPYVNMRLFMHDINRDGKKELVVVKNFSSTGRLLQNLKSFTSSEIYDLEWNGLGFVENWKTKKIQGYCSDYQIKDIDNDGKPDLVLLLGVSFEATFEPRSVIVAYSLSPQ